MINKNKYNKNIDYNDHKIKAFIFDLGGVILGSPLEAIHMHEIKYNLPKNFINYNISLNPNSAFRKLEKGIIDIPKFINDFKIELDSENAIKLYMEYNLKKKNKKLNRNEFPKNGFNIDTNELFSEMMKYSSYVHSNMLHCLFLLRSLGYIVIALTNNFKPMVN